MPIHPTAIVTPTAKIDATADIGPFCVIGGQVEIGPRVKLWPNAYVTGWTTIAEDCELHPNVVVGHAAQDVKYDGSETYCRIGARTILRENVTIHRGTAPKSSTVVGEDCFLLAGAHVGHNCTVGSRVTLINNALLAGHVTVGDGVTMGGAAAVHQFVRIGELAMIGGNARVAMDVPPFALVDVDGKIVASNRVGIARSKLSKDEALEIKTVYRKLHARAGHFAETVAEISALVKTPAGQRLAAFLSADSRRGIAGPAKTSRRA